MSLLTDEDRRQLLENGSTENRGKDHFPVVKLFLTDAHGQWLLTELDPDDPDLAFGLCDLGYPELGSCLVSDLESIGGKLGLPVERDTFFEAKYPISVYARAARLAQEITDDQRLLSLANDDADSNTSKPPPPKPQP